MFRLTQCLRVQARRSHAPRPQRRVTPPHSAVRIALRLDACEGREATNTLLFGGLLGVGLDVPLADWADRSGASETIAAVKSAAETAAVSPPMTPAASLLPMLPLSGFDHDAAPPTHRASQPLVGDSTVHTGGNAPLAFGIMLDEPAPAAVAKPSAAPTAAASVTSSGAAVETPVNGALGTQSMPSRAGGGRANRGRIRGPTCPRSSPDRPPRGPPRTGRWPRSPRALRSLWELGAA
jgi:hypothetical protein